MLVGRRKLSGLKYTVHEKNASRVEVLQPMASVSRGGEYVTEPAFVSLLNILPSLHGQSTHRKS